MPDDKLVIDIAELVAEAEALLAEARREERPEHRISKIVGEMRAYKAAVVRANVPRADGSDEDRLRDHRDASRAPGAPLVTLRAWLAARDTAYLLGPQALWRLDDADWEGEVWSPLAEWVERGYALLYGGAGGAGWPCPVPPDAFRAWEGEELELEHRLLARIAVFVPVGDGLTLDPADPFTIRWNGVACRLGDNDGFRIAERLARAKGRKVSREDIGLAVNNDDYSDDALRTAASRLKAKLKQYGLGDLAARIKTSEGGRFIYVAPPEGTA